MGAFATLALAGCQSAGSTSGGSEAAVSAAPTSSTPAVAGAPVGDRLREAMAGSSLSGQNIASQPFCTYYGADGTALNVISGAAQTGTWAVDGRFVCETYNGVQGCTTLDFLPVGGGVTVTLADGSGGFSYPAQIASGNTCG